MDDRINNMSKAEISNRLEFVVACVGEFAQRYTLSNMEAYAYLRRFSGIEFLLKHYEPLHTLSVDEVVDDLKSLCKRNGGRVA